MNPSQGLSPTEFAAIIDATRARWNSLPGHARRLLFPQQCCGCGWISVPTSARIISFCGILSGLASTLAIASIGSVGQRPGEGWAPMGYNMSTSSHGMQAAAWGALAMPLAAAMRDGQDDVPDIGFAGQPNFDLPRGVVMALLAIGAALGLARLIISTLVCVGLTSDVTLYPMTTEPNTQPPLSRVAGAVLAQTPVKRALRGGRANVVLQFVELAIKAMQVLLVAGFAPSPAGLIIGAFIGLALEYVLRLHCAGLVWQATRMQRWNAVYTAVPELASAAWQAALFTPAAGVHAAGPSGGVASMSSPATSSLNASYAGSPAPAPLYPQAPAVVPSAPGSQV